MLRRAQLEFLKDLAVPRPFTMTGFRSRLEECCGRDIQIESSVMAPGAPSGIWLRTARADYLYYEEQTSAFHQAHIVLHLSAHLLLGDRGAGVLDKRLVPNGSCGLVRTILGDVEPSPVSDLEAESFAYLALRPAGRFMTGQTMAAALRQLRPLHSALRDAVPLAGRSLGSDDRPDVGRQLYQVVVEIREAALALRPYRNPEAEAAAAECARAVGLAERQIAAVAEATALTGAIRRSKTGATVSPKGVDKLHPTGPDLASEAVWLALVARAFSGSSPLRQT